MTEAALEEPWDTAQGWGTPRGPAHTPVRFLFALPGELFLRNRGPGSFLAFDFPESPLPRVVVPQGTPLPHTAPPPPSGLSDAFASVAERSLAGSNPRTAALTWLPSSFPPEREPAAQEPGVSLALALLRVPEDLSPLPLEPETGGVCYGYFQKSNLGQVGHVLQSYTWNDHMT